MRRVRSRAPPHPGVSSRRALRRALSASTAIPEIVRDVGAQHHLIEPRIAVIAERRLGEETHLNGQFGRQAKEANEVPVLTVG